MSKNKCFLDTSALIALNDANDQYHHQAREIASTLKDYEFILSDAVITETYALLRYRIGYSIAFHFLESVMNGNEFTIAEVTPSIRRTTLKILSTYDDQKISYCDALSVAIMMEQNIHKVFSFDNHFEIMGMGPVRP